MHSWTKRNPWWILVPFVAAKITYICVDSQGILPNCIFQGLILELPNWMYCITSALALNKCHSKLLIDPSNQPWMATVQSNVLSWSHTNSIKHKQPVNLKKLTSKWHRPKASDVPINTRSHGTSSFSRNHTRSPTRISCACTCSANPLPFQLHSPMNIWQHRAMSKSVDFGLQATREVDSRPPKSCIAKYG